ncbi:MAG: tetratricopeptide repeat protein [Candidatus Sedimenticola sp. (ex Thyasira tokunagai)]
MKVAAEACYRAYVNVEWGNLGPEIRSEKLYNFGRVLRKAGRYDDAREALTRAIAEEEKLSGRNSQKSGRRIAELAATYIELNQQDQGLGLVDELIPIADGYSPGEKQFIAALLYYYRQHLGNLHPEKSAAYKAKMKDLGYSEDYFEKQR